MSEEKQNAVAPLRSQALWIFLSAASVIVVLIVADTNALAVWITVALVFSVILTASAVVGDDTGTMISTTAW